MTRGRGDGAPRWMLALLRRVAPQGRAADVLGDLDEAHRTRLERHGRPVASLLTGIDALDMARALLRERLRGAGRGGRNAGPFVPGVARGRNGPGVSLLDFKLGLRMLVRYPGLTVVAGVAMAFAIAVGAGTFEFLKDVMFPTLPLEDGDRVVRLQVRDAAAGGPTAVDPADFQAWRTELRTVPGPGAFHGVVRVLRLGDGAEVPVSGVAVSPSAFDVARVPPLLGRPLVAADEAAGAAPVVVLGHDLWRARFGSDPDVVGRRVGLGTERTTVVGVMPEGFAFPIPADVLVPIHLDELAARSRSGEPVPGVVGFGRLAPGATLEEASAEMAVTAVGETASPEEREHLTPTVDRFAHPVVTVVGIATNLFLALVGIFLILIVVVVCANVALLLFARAATREGEMAVRTALGASRGRIVGQLFAEALVLAGVAALLGLWGASAGLEWAVELMGTGEPLPFWIQGSLSPATVGWAVVLALLGATVAGVTPALQVTRGGLRGKLQGAGRGSGVRLGHLWTAIVVTQVALTVLFMPVVLAMGSFWWTVRSSEPGVPAEELLVATLETEGDAARLDAAVGGLRDRLTGEPWVRGVALAERIWPGWRWDRPIDVEGDPPWAGPPADRRALHMAITPDFFEVTGARLVAGRGLTGGDVDAGAPVVVVDESFVERLLGGRYAVGRRIRIGGMDDAGRPTRAGGASGARPEKTDPAGAWREIVGVVADLGLNPVADLSYRGAVFHPLSPAGADRLALAVRVAGEPGSYANRLRILALETDPPVRLRDPVALDRRMERPVGEYAAWLRVVAGAGAIAILLTLAGIYAVMAFTVSRRTREIGVRVALGGVPRQVAFAVLSRGIRHVGYGVLCGGLLIPLLLFVVQRVTEPGPDLPPPLVGAAMLAGYAGLMMAVCLLACVVPMRRALGVEPTEALAADG